MLANRIGIYAVLTAVMLSCSPAGEPKKKSATNSGDAEVDTSTDYSPTQMGACAGVSESLNNVEECRDGMSRRKCEAANFAELWPKSKATGINANAKPVFVADRLCESFSYRNGVE